MREELGWNVDSDEFSILIDDRYDGFAILWFSAGADVVGVVPTGVTNPRTLQVAPQGTRFRGKVYIIPEKQDDGSPGRVVVKYDRVKVPGKDELPVCFVVEQRALAVKDSAAKTLNGNRGGAVSEWP